MSKIDRQLEITAPLRVAALPPVRHQVSDFLSSRVAEDELADILLCLQEAMKNAVRFSGSDEGLYVAVRLLDHSVRLVVRDHGVGFANKSRISAIAAARPDPMTSSGRGLYLMTQLMDEVELLCDHGTEVRMLKHLD